MYKLRIPIYHSIFFNNVDFLKVIKYVYRCKYTPYILSTQIFIPAKSAWGCLLPSTFSFMAVYHVLVFYYYYFFLKSCSFPVTVLSFPTSASTNSLGLDFWVCIHCCHVKKVQNGGIRLLLWGIANAVQVAICTCKFWWALFGITCHLCKYSRVMSPCFIFWTFLRSDYALDWMC